MSGSWHMVFGHLVDGVSEFFRRSWGDALEYWLVSIHGQHSSIGLIAGQVGVAGVSTICYNFPMTKKKVTTQAKSLTVQGAPVEGRVLVNVPIDHVIPDPERPNIRGRIVDTTDLQPSIKENGIQVPIQVRVAPGKPGYFYRIAGARRQIAARAVGLQFIPVIVEEDIDEGEIRRLMLISDLHKAEPHIVLDKEGNAVAGKCRAVWEEIEYGESTRQELATAMGVSPDIIGAYYCLYDEIPAIQVKVAKGQMAITVYSLIKHHGPKVKHYMAQKRGKVSARYVRDALRGWKGEEPGIDISVAIQEKEGEEPKQTAPVTLNIKRMMTVPQLLGNSLDSLNRIAQSDANLSGTDWAVLNAIDSIIGKIRKRDA